MQSFWKWSRSNKCHLGRSTLGCRRAALPVRHYLTISDLSAESTQINMYQLITAVTGPHMKAQYNGSACECINPVDTVLGILTRMT